MSVSRAVFAALSTGESQTLVEGPCVITDLIVTETSLSAPASVGFAAVGDGVTYAMISVPSGQTLSWHGALALRDGLLATSQLGELAITVGYY